MTWNAGHAIGYCTGGGCECNKPAPPECAICRKPKCSDELRPLPEAPDFLACLDCLSTECPACGEDAVIDEECRVCEAVVKECCACEGTGEMTIIVGDEERGMGPCTRCDGRKVVAVREVSDVAA